MVPTCSTCWSCYWRWTTVTIQRCCRGGLRPTALIQIVGPWADFPKNDAAHRTGTSCNRHKPDRGEDYKYRDAAPAVELAPWGLRWGLYLSSGGVSLSMVALSLQSLSWQQRGQNIVSPSSFYLHSIRCAHYMI